jgi:hypothetical protein
LIERRTCHVSQKEDVHDHIAIAESMLRSLDEDQDGAQSSTYRSEVYMNMLTHIPALASAFLGGTLLYLSIYLPIESNIFAALLAGAGTMAIAYSYGSLRQMTR